MSGKIEYLERYSVAPSPSRDYYGLRVLHDEVTLYQWRISHGPHKTPIVRTSHFANFERNKLLQDEICRAFGDRLLKHVQCIARGETNSLLTLPNCLIKRLSRFLPVQDIIKLSSLSHVSNTIFNDNSLWKSLHKRYCGTNWRKPSSYRGMACDWKKLFKEEHLREYLSDKKKTRDRTGSMTGKEKSLKKEVDRPINSRPKAISKLVSAESVPQKSTEQVPLKSEPKHPKQAIPKPQKVATSEKVSTSGKEVSEIKSLQRISQTNLRHLRKQSSTAINKAKIETESKTVANEQGKESKPPKDHSKVPKTTAISRTSHTSLKASDSKLSTCKSKSSLISKTAKSEKSSIRDSQSGVSKSQVKSKPKKIGESKSTILTTDKAYRRGASLIRNESLDLTDLIEASLKNICSPRTIFDSEFSFIDRSGGCSGDSKLQSSMHEKRYKRLESSKGTRVNRMGTVLESVSEKSEPITTRITDLDRKIERLADIVSSSSKDLHANTTKTDKPRLKKDKSLPTATRRDKNDYYERYGVYNRPSTSPEVNNTQMEGANQGKAVDKIDILKWLGASSISSRSPFGLNEGHNEMEKALEDLYKQKFRRKN